MIGHVARSRSAILLVVSAAHEWNAKEYERLSEPQFAWGLRVLERLPLEGEEAVVDAGCGSGRLTRVLAERLPRGRVVAVDRSANMVAEARERLADLARVSFAVADLTTWVASPAVDAVFSTATFHWLHDHARLFASVHASLRPGGRLVAQCGGEGNLERFHAIAEEVYRSAPFEEHFRGFEPTWNFQPASATEARLRAAGFVEVACDLELAPTPFEDAGTFRAFVQNVVLRSHLQRLPDAAARSRFLDEVTLRAKGSGTLSLDYVRLNIRARRG